MDANGRQQAYDRGHTIFSPDGRLYQVEYARKAVERGSPSVGVLTEDGVVLAARKRLRSPLLDPETIAKIHRVDDHVAIASAGHAADARRLVEAARVESQRHRVRYGEPIPVESLTTAVADHVQEYTQSGGSRPFGTALLVAGVDSIASGVGSTARATAADGVRDRPRLFEIDPSGTPYGWRAVAIGDGATEIRRRFEDRLGGGTAEEHRSDETGDGRSADPGGDGAEAGDEDDLDGDAIHAEAGLVEALDALQTTSEESLSAGELDVWSIDSSTVAPLSTDEIVAALDGAAS